jgi:lipopolysaccharide/colanic/teichoic acid biosynthesis glycosyltransferase
LDTIAASAPKQPYRTVKRMLDAVAAASLLVAAAPILLLVAILVRINLGTPVLFRQERAGLRGHRFVMLKFRSMSDERGPDGCLLPDAERLGRLGRLLRATSLDELPELWNVLCGEMSLVGPRPLLLEYLPLYTAEQARRHLVRPGITGLAQVNGRNDISWPRKLRLDVEYVDRCSLMLDAKILLLTLVRVIRANGITQPGHVSAERFKGEHL